MRNEYINVKVSAREEIFDLIYGMTFGFPYTGIEELFDELIFSFPKDKWTDKLKNDLEDILHRCDSEAGIKSIETVTDRNWNEEWEKNVNPVRISDKITITPSWRKDETDAEIKIIIDPKMSFGTGEHATTRLVCRLMENLALKGKTWIDAGTGTGILAILAAKLGAKEILALDNNIWSIENAGENFEINGVKDRIKLVECDIESCELPEADGISANLFRNLLLPAFPKFYSSLQARHGDLLISGILKYDFDEIIRSAEFHKFKCKGSLFEDEWTAVHFILNRHQK